MSQRVVTIESSSLLHHSLCIDFNLIVATSMPAEQPTKLYKLLRKIKVKVSALTNRFSPSSPHPPFAQLLLLTIPSRYFCCDYISFVFGGFQFVNVFTLTLMCVHFLKSVKDNSELLPVWERAAYSAYHL